MNNAEWNLSDIYKTEEDLQKDWNWIRYQIGGKMFAAVCHRGKRRCLPLRLLCAG